MADFRASGSVARAGASAVLPHARDCRPDGRRIADFQEGCYPALAKVDDWLTDHDWLVDERYTVADIGMFGYVSMAPQGGYDMERFPSISAWLARVKAQPGWVPLVEETQA